MKLIVGLGNPGAAYAHSRHNIGFEVVDSLAKSHKAKFKKEKGISALVTKINAPDSVTLALPLTFMNLSGLSVSSLLKKHKVELADLLVVCDDLDLEFGRMKIRPEGSSGGHRGLDSIIANLGTNKFARLRLGIGRPTQGREASEYVLSRFNSGERHELKALIERACECINLWLEDGAEKAMNRYNINPLKKSKST